MQRYFFCKSGLSLVEVIRRESPALIALEELVARLESDPSLSAESNTLNRLEPAEGDFIRFFTGPDEFAVLQAQALSEHYRNRGMLTAVEVLPWQYEQAEQLRLYDFTLRVMRRVLACSDLNMVPEFIATSGFKHEIIFMAALGLCERIPVRYLKEGSGELVTLPPLPMRWDTSVMDKYDSFFDAVLENAVDGRTLKTALHRDPVLKPFFVIDERDGRAILSPFGEVMRLARVSTAMRQAGFNARRIIPEGPVEDLVTGLDNSVSAYTLKIVDFLTRVVFVRGIYTPKTRPTKDGESLTELKVEDGGKTDTLYLRLPDEYPEGHDKMKSVLEALV